ncbi:MAG: pseudouridine-5'-phosphate glycosidase [Aridibacter sp.]
MMKFNSEVSEALANGKPIVALESTVIAHGLPYPENIQTAEILEKIVRENGAVPATIAVFDGEFCVGLNKNQIAQLATDKNIRKISRRDLSVAVAKKLNCATTVATTMFIAHRAGINVLATGGIGGIHRGFSADVSADLPELAQTPMITVCSGAKIVLDLPRTREWLETHGVTILGYKCDELPAFYSHKSGLDVDEKVDSVAEIVEIADARNKLNLPNAILVTVPVPQEFEIDAKRLEYILEKSLELAKKENVQGKNLTPFLLSKMSELSIGQTLQTNIALLENNAKIAAKIAVAMK